MKIPITKENIDSLTIDTIHRLPFLDSSDCDSVTHGIDKELLNWATIDMPNEHFHMNPIIEWLYDNLQDQIKYDHFFQRFWFKDDIDAMAFRLRWS